MDRLSVPVKHTIQVNHLHVGMQIQGGAKSIIVEPLVLVLRAQSIWIASILSSVDRIYNLGNHELVQITNLMKYRCILKVA